MNLTKHCCSVTHTSDDGDRSVRNVDSISSVIWSGEGRSANLVSKPNATAAHLCRCQPPRDDNLCCSDLSCSVYGMEEECGDNCPARQWCGNKRIQRRKWKSVQIVATACTGFGVKTLEPIQRDEFIVEYVGLAVSKGYLSDVPNMEYIMRLEGDTYIDARHQGNYARFINHSCDPNCIVKKWKVNGITRICIFAKKAIQPGEELTFDYAWDTTNKGLYTKCYCHADGCRGSIERRP